MNSDSVLNVSAYTFSSLPPGKDAVDLWPTENMKKMIMYFIHTSLRKVNIPDMRTVTPCLPRSFYVELSSFFAC